MQQAFFASQFRRLPKVHLGFQTFAPKRAVRLFDPFLGLTTADSALSSRSGDAPGAPSGAFTMTMRDGLTLVGQDGPMYPISAITGVSQAAVRFERASQRLMESVSGLSGDDPAQAAVDQIQAKAQFTAGVRTLRVADEMTATLLDIIA